MLCSGDFEGTHDAVILSEQSEHLDVIEIRIKECKGLEFNFDSCFIFTLL
jgi:hypothetical protein